MSRETPTLPVHQNAWIVKKSKKTGFTTLHVFQLCVVIWRFCMFMIQI